MLDQMFANLASGFAATFGAPFQDAVAVTPGVPVTDTGGSITTPASPTQRPCKVQFDVMSEAMRVDAGAKSTDVRILILAGSMTGALDTTAEIVVTTGASAGTWSIESCDRDPARIGWDCRGRKVG